VSVALLVAGCSGDDAGGDESSTCALRGAVTGAIAWSIATADPVACGIPFAGGEGSWMWFYPVSGDVASFVVDVAGVTSGQTGDFPASVEVNARDQRSWKTPASCSVTITQNLPQADGSYQVVATGTCSAPAQPHGSAQGELTVSPFALRFPARF
jgi:hypothetical protein